MEHISEIGVLQIGVQLSILVVEYRTII